jgi:CBS domain-containing membrane protein
MRSSSEEKCSPVCGSSLYDSSLKASSNVEQRECDLSWQETVVENVVVGGSAKSGEPAESRNVRASPLNLKGVPHDQLRLLTDTKLWVYHYLFKFKGKGDKALQSTQLSEIALTFLGVFVSLLILCAMTEFLSPLMDDVGWVITSFGASAVIIYAAPESKLAQPWNVLGGQVIGAMSGVLIQLALPDPWAWIAGPLATAVAAAVMQVTRSVHPPAGGTALAIGLSSLGPWEGFQVVVTVIMGSIMFIFLGAIINNLSPKRSYPSFWSPLP